MNQSPQTSPAPPHGETSLKLPVFSPETWSKLLFCAGLILFLVYGSFRQRYIWGVDSFGYYQQGKLISEGRVLLPIAPEFKSRTALVPWGFKLPAPQDAGAIPEYPPGFPLLLSVGHLVRAPHWVTPACGVVSCVLLFGLLRRHVTAGGALLFTAAWAVMPLTVYGSTMLMSDLVAAMTLMGGLLAYRRDRLALSAWIFGLSVAVRPTNVLFFLPFALVLRWERKTLHLLLHLMAPAALYAGYNYLLYGAPWRTGYGNVWSNMQAEIVPAQFAFFATTTWSMLSPLLIGLAAVGLIKWDREKLFLLLWALVFMVFYAFWAGGGADRWWWARFILPGYPALFLLAAEGFSTARRWGEERLRWPGLWTGALAVLVIILPIQYVRYGQAQGHLWTRATGAVNYEVMRRVSEFAPPGSLVGSVEHTSTFFLYSSLIPFVAVAPGAPELIAEGLATGRRVFFLPEPWNHDNSVVVEIMRRYEAREVAKLDSPWVGLTLYELHKR